MSRVRIDRPAAAAARQDLALQRDGLAGRGLGEETGERQIVAVQDEKLAIRHKPAGELQRPPRMDREVDGDQHARVSAAGSGLTVRTGVLP